MNDESKQVNGIPTKLVRIDASLHQQTKMEAVKRFTTIRGLVEEGLAEVLAVNPEEGEA